MKIETDHDASDISAKVMPTATIIGDTSTMCYRDEMNVRVLRESPSSREMRALAESS